MDLSSGRHQFFELAEEYSGLVAEERDLVQRTNVLLDKINRANDPVFKNFHRRQLARLRPKLDAVQARTGTILETVRKLQIDQASVPNSIDDLDPRLPRLRVELDEVEHRLMNLRGLTPTTLDGGGRQRLARQLEDQAGALARKIRGLEADLLATIEDEEEVRG